MIVGANLKIYTLSTHTCKCDEKHIIMNKMFKRHRKKNLLVLGSSGGVSNAFLRYLIHHRDYFNKLILLDRNERVKSDIYLDHKGLDYTFIHKEIKLPEEEEAYLRILHEHRIDIVLDLTDMNSIPALEATNKAGVSYINTAMCDTKRIVSELVHDVYARKDTFNKAVHILCTGMNPGVVNMWVRFGIEKFGVPTQITHFEYDTSTEAQRWKSMMTWSLKEYVIESVRDPSGIVEGRDKVKLLYPNALSHRVPMRHLLAPIMDLPQYPNGFQVMHEENLSIGQRYNVPSQFIYAVDMNTMEFLINKYETTNHITVEDLVLGNNTSQILDGADNIGVILDYPDKNVYYFNSSPNVSAIGTNGTYTQVVVGVFSALCVLLFDRLPKKAYFVEDLFDSHYRYFLFDNMRVEEYVFKKHGESMKLLEYNPKIRLKRRKRFEHFYF